MPDTIHDVEEIKRKLRELGVPVDGWGKTEEREVASPFLDRQTSLLTKAKDMLEGQLAEDQRTVAELHEKVARLKHGGGL